MSKTEWIGLLASVGIVIVALTWFLTSFILFKEGAKVSRLYYEATGQFPSESWLENNIIKGYDSPQELLDSLKPY